MFSLLAFPVQNLDFAPDRGDKKFNVQINSHVPTLACAVFDAALAILLCVLAFKYNSPGLGLAAGLQCWTIPYLIVSTVKGFKAVKLHQLEAINPLAKDQYLKDNAQSATNA